MTSLRNKLSKNFIAGMLECILIFSILITLFINIKYDGLVKIIDDKKPDLIGEWFIRLNNNDNITSEEMWKYLSDISDQQNVNIKYVDVDGKLLRFINSISDSKNTDIKTKSYNIYNTGKKTDAGKLIVEYRSDHTFMNKLKNDVRVFFIIAILFSLVIGIVIAILLATNIAKPILGINSTTVKLKKGIYTDNDKIDSDIREITSLQDNINFLSKSLNREEEIRKKYAQDISHELRTPLANLALVVEALEGGIINFDTEVARTLNGEIKRLEALVNGLKDSFNESVSMNKLNLEDTNVTELVEELLNNFTANFLKRNITLHVNLDQNVHLISDKTKLYQIIQNLLTNAIKAINTNGNISVSVIERSKSVSIKIADDGVGISQDKIDMIFERFYRIDDSRNTKTNGLGLGLSIVKNFVEALNGKIDVASTLGEGTTFTVIFDKKAQ
ncbi:HAMP domain-containing sensor histidine kinase [Anaerococcus sp. AGMB09787]|uniref:sensor histidine kinase n=1 Tax=Anaerococcus sp. AGMB09787 TaxID=2922869 RepID=UPI001FAE8E71|nr:HAMP domain-containing sensor histidine kinase [Anaerococcus sp. AGMB09787]